MSTSISFKLIEVTTTEIMVHPIDEESKKNGTLTVSFEEPNTTFQEDGKISMIAEVDMIIKKNRFKIDLFSVIKVRNCNLNYKDTIDTYNSEITKPILIKASNLLSSLNDEVSEFPVLIDLHELFIRRSKEQER